MKLYSAGLPRLHRIARLIAERAPINPEQPTQLYTLNLRGSEIEELRNALDEVETATNSAEEGALI